VVVTPLFPPNPLILGVGGERRVEETVPDPLLMFCAHAGSCRIEKGNADAHIVRVCEVGHRVDEMNWNDEEIRLRALKRRSCAR